MTDDIRASIIGTRERRILRRRILGYRPEYANCSDSSVCGPWEVAVVQLDAADVSAKMAELRSEQPGFFEFIEVVPP